MVTMKTEFTQSELLADHDISEPQIDAWAQKWVSNSARRSSRTRSTADPRTFGTSNSRGSSSAPGPREPTIRALAPIQSQSLSSTSRTRKAPSVPPLAPRRHSRTAYRRPGGDIAGAVARNYAVAFMGRPSFLRDHSTRATSCRTSRSFPAPQARRGEERAPRRAALQMAFPLGQVARDRRDRRGRTVRPRVARRDYRRTARAW
jgi:hypothetical protein